MSKLSTLPFPRKLIAGTLTLALGGAIWMVSQPSNAAAEKEKPKPPQVLELAASDVVTVAHGALKQPVALSGSLSPVRQTLLSADVDATVSEVLVRPGESVKAGQLLARLDTRELQDQLVARSASLERARAELQLAEKNRARSADLLKQNFISPTSHDATENQHAVALAQLKAEEAQVALARKSLGDAAVRAPFSGVLSERHIEPGARVGTGQKLFALVDLDELEFEARVPMAGLPLVKTGQEVALRIEGFHGKEFSGRVERIAPVAEAGSRMVPLYIRVKNSDGLLRGGMFAQGEVAVAHASDTDYLPMAAVRGMDKNQPYVLTVEGGKVIERKISLGLINPLSKQAAIASGLKAGQYVITAKLDQIKPGQQVKLPEAKPQKS